MNKIVVVEDEEMYLIGIVEALQWKGYKNAVGVPVFRTDDCQRVVLQIKHLNPDLVLMDHKLTLTLRGDDVLKALGGEFYKPGMVGGNPRVISISSDPKVMLDLVGGHFGKKMMIRHFSEELLGTIADCLHRVNHPKA